MLGGIHSLTGGLFRPKRMSILKPHGKEIGRTTSRDEYVFCGLYEDENECIGSSEVEIKSGPHTT